MSQGQSPVKPQLVFLGLDPSHFSLFSLWKFRISSVFDDPEKVRANYHNKIWQNMYTQIAAPR